jgi:AcrR family transcriptional regulator
MDAQQPLTKTRIAEEALKLIDEVGLKGCTLRRLAGALGTATPNLYTHYKTKEALLEGVTQLVLAKVDAPTGVGWRETVERIMRSFRAVGLRHRHMEPLLTHNPPQTLGALLFVEAGFGALRSEGFDDDAIASSYGALAKYSIGDLTTQVNNYFDGHPAVQKDAGTLDADTMARVLPNITKVGPTLAAQDPDVEFEKGLKLILDGLDLLRKTRTAEASRPAGQSPESVGIHPSR